MEQFCQVEVPSADSPCTGSRELVDQNISLYWRTWPQLSGILSLYETLDGCADQKMSPESPLW